MKLIRLYALLWLSMTIPIPNSAYPAIPAETEAAVPESFDRKAGLELYEDILKDYPPIRSRVIEIWDDRPILSYSRSIPMTEAIWKMIEEGEVSREDGIAFDRRVIDRSQELCTEFPLTAIMNDGALHSHLPTAGTDLLMTAFQLSSLLGEIHDIEIFLRYSYIFVGNSYDAMESPPNGSSAAFLGITRTPAQRMKYWPAANAIVTHATKTIPMLKGLLWNTSVRDELRDRAAGFLILLDRSYLDKHLISVMNEDEKDAFYARLQKGYVDYIRLQSSWGPLPQPERRKLNRWYQDLNRMR
ncbi:MAG: hypothetical protein ACE15F_13500 [bacterium]